ncbi:MAG: hypothetical protein FJ126_08445 [Deltaproteobacteria bacterium]|nr:hypothetical protein [Deltaproteobacteria bacterium]
MPGLFGGALERLCQIRPRGDCSHHGGLPGPGRAQVSGAANRRYLEALAGAHATTPLGSLTEKLCRPTTWKGKRVRALNPYGPEDLALLKAVARGEFNLNGFRNRDLVKLLFS